MVLVYLSFSSGMPKTPRTRPLMCLLSVGLGIVVTGVPAVANTITATGLSPSQVQAAINHAASGDTVVIPNGSATWTSGVSISGKAIHLRGAGSVTLVHNLPASPLITITEAAAGPVEISHLHFAAGLNEYTIVVMGGGRPALIHDNQWTGNISGIRFETLHGVVWGNTFDTQDINYLNTGATQFVSQKLEGVPDSVWLGSSTMGTLDSDGEHNLYVEDNSIRLVCCGATDPDDNARMVIRHNTFDNSATASHGADTSSIGARHVELYDNTYIFTDFGDCDGSRTTNLPYLQHIRGGTWVITGNVFPDVSSCAWGDKRGIVATVMNLQRDAGPYACWGDGNHQAQHYPAPHQVGQGANGKQQVLDPVYIWGNSGSVSGSTTGRYSIEDYGPGECRPPLASVTTYIVTGRDVILDRAKPGWTRYQYPHPLRSGRTSTAPPPSPTNLRIGGN
jgi:hypothetical protein